MAVTITGEAAVTSLGTVHVYTLSGADVGTAEAPKAVIWSGDNTFDLRVGEYVKVTDAETGAVTYTHKEHDSEGFPVINTRRCSMIVDEDVHAQTNMFKVYASCIDATTGLPAEAKFEGQIAITVPRSVDDKTFAPIYPTQQSFNDNATDPATIAVEFKSTYSESDDGVEHYILLSCDSLHSYDDNRGTENKVTPAGQKITHNITLADWSVNGEYTGYVTLTVNGEVRKAGAEAGATPLKQAGYRLFIEYHNGAAVRVRVLRAGESKVLLVE